MRLHAGFEIAFDIPRSVPMLLMLSVHPEREADLLTPTPIRFEPALPSTTYRDWFDNVCTRIVAPPGRLVISSVFDVRDTGQADPADPAALEHRVEDLPNEMLMFLLGSRYCETDKLTDTAWSLFGRFAPGFARVQAICDFVHKHIKFDYMQASSTRGAWDAFQDGVGVCRDYAHLAVAFTRCMNIPARYCTGYLGDVGTPPPYPPGDFSAWFEVYIGGRWTTFDARFNVPRIGRILMARGRDATDVAITTSFGSAPLAGFTVVTDEVVES